MVVDYNTQCITIMKNKNRNLLLTNSVFAALTSMSDLLFFALLVLISRFVGIEHFGIFNTGMAITSIAIYAINLGLDSLAIRYIAAEKADTRELMGSILIWKSIITFFLSLIFFPAIYILVEGDTSIYVFSFLLVAAILRSYNATMRAYLQGHEKFKLESFIVIFERLSIFLFGFISLYVTNNITYLAASFIVGRLITFMLYFYIINKHVLPIIWNFNLRSILNFQAEALPLGFATIIYGVYLQLDIIALSYFHSEIQVGYYAAAYKLYEGLLVVPLIITSVMYPRLSTYYANNIIKFDDLFQRSFKYMLIVGLLFSSIGILFSNNIINTLYGVNFTPSATPLPLLLVSLLFFCLTTVMHMNFRSTGRLKSVLYTLIIGLIVKSIANLLLLENYGIHGAASSNLLAAIAMFISANILLIKNKQHAFKTNSTIKVLAATATSVAICIAIDFNFWITSLFLFLFCYGIALFVFRVFDKVELDLMSEVRKKLLIW